MDIMEKIRRENLKTNLPEFRPGDTVRVHCKIREGDKERVQLFEGVCLKRNRGAIEASFTVRKVSYGVGVERVFPSHSPLIEKVEVVSKGRVRRSRLYYLRELSGKAARIREKQREEFHAQVAGEVLPEATQA